MVTVPIVSHRGLVDISETPKGDTVYRYIVGDNYCLQKLIQADTDKKLRSFLENYQDLFNDASKGAGTIRDLASIQSILISAFGFWGMSQNNALCSKDFLKTPIQINEFTSFSDFKRFVMDKKIPLWLPFDEEEEEDNFNNFLEESGSLISGIYEVSIEADYYLDFLSLGVQRACELNLPCSVEASTLRIYLGTFPKTLGAYYQFVEDTLDTLFAVHLQDIITVTEKCVLTHYSNSLLSSIWLNLSDSFTGGRVGRCKVCNKPFVAFNERGNKRLFCSQACNKKHQRLKLFKYHLDKGLTPEECAKIAKVRLKDGLEFVSNTNST